MHVPLAPPLPPEVSAAGRRPDDSKVYTASLREMDSLVGAVKSASDDTDKDNTLIWFTGLSAVWIMSFLPHYQCDFDRFFCYMFVLGSNRL